MRSAQISRRSMLATTGRAALAVVAGGAVANARPFEGDEALHALEGELRASLADQQAALSACLVASDLHKAGLADRDGVDDAEAQFGVTMDSTISIARRIVEIPAATLAGVLVKLRLKDVWEDSGLLEIDGREGRSLAEDLIISVADDLEAMRAVGTDV